MKKEFIFVVLLVLISAFLVGCTTGKVTTTQPAGLTVTSTPAGLNIAIYEPVVSGSGKSQGQQIAETSIKCKTSTGALTPCKTNYMFSTTQSSLTNKPIVVGKTYHVQVTPPITTGIQYQSVSSQNIIIVDGQNTADFKFQEKPYGSLKVTTVPAGAKITVNGETKLTNTLLKYYILGAKTVTASATGYVSQTKTVEVKQGQTAVADFKLVPATPTTGTLSIKSEPKGATISVDNIKKQTDFYTGMLTLTGISAGTKQITASNLSYVDQTKTVVLNGGQTAYVEFNLTRKY